MELTRFAERLLRLHADRPGALFYGTAALGSMYRDSDLTRLDDGYRELERAGYLRQSGDELSFFGNWKKLYSITDAGTDHVKAEAVG